MRPVHALALEAADKFLNGPTRGNIAHHKAGDEAWQRENREPNLVQLRHDDQKRANTQRRPEHDGQEASHPSASSLFSVLGALAIFLTTPSNAASSSSHSSWRARSRNLSAWGLGSSVMRCAILTFATLSGFGELAILLIRRGVFDHIRSLGENSQKCSHAALAFD